MALFPNYNRFDLAVKSAKGTIITDVNDKAYLDFGAGIGVCNLGHRHEAVQAAVEEQLNLYWHVSNLYHNPIQEEVAQLITENSVGDNVFFCNSGAEANEAAIKLARRATGKEKIISFQQSFHGRTFATMAATGQDKVREGFGPMLQSFAYANYNDIDSVKALIDENTAAVMLEVVQGEGGVIPATDAFITALDALCKEHGILIIIDEIQTGIGRTGTRLAYEQFNIEPDIFTLAKGLGNGLPVGATVAKKDIAASFGPGTHGSTFGGNPLAMASAKAVLSIMFQDDFLQDVTARADYLMEQLEKEIAVLPFVKNIRGKGFMIGIECEDKVAPIMKQLMADGLIVLNAGDNVLRLLPPVTVTKTEIDQAVAMIKTAIEKIK